MDVDAPRALPVTRYRRGAAVLLFFLGATTFYAYPLVFRLPSALMIGLGGYLGEIAVVTWKAYQVVRAPPRLFESPSLYPYSKTVAFGQSLFFNAVSATPETGLVLTRYVSSDFVRSHPTAPYALRFDRTDPEVRRCR